jgi:hypothetical protein
MHEPAQSSKQASKQATTSNKQAVKDREQRGEAKRRRSREEKGREERGGETYSR